MMTLPVLLIVALLLLGFVLVRRRRRAVAVPPGPRTVAELVRQRATTGTRPLEPADLIPVMDAPTEEICPAPTDDVAEHVTATDLALLRTFGPIEPDAGLDPAAVVALEAPTQHDVAPEPGAAQDLRFRTLRHDGEPVVDAAVALLDDRGREASAGRSDSGGTGELRAPHPGSYVLVATAPDHQPGAVALTVADAPVDCAVLLVRSAVLVGLVTVEDGPVVGAEVTLAQDGDVVETTDTDAEGRFRIADLPAGEYSVSVTAAGCEFDVDLVRIPDEAEQVHDVDLAPAGIAAR